MELPVGLFVGFLHTVDIFDNGLRLHILDIHRGGVPQQSKHGRMGSHPGIDRDVILLLQFFRKILSLLFCGPLFQYNDHFTRHPFYPKPKIKYIKKRNSL